MFTYAENYEFSKEQLFHKVDELKSKGYEVITSKLLVIDDLYIDKIIIRHGIAKKRLIINIGLHGIEGYVGHACLMTFFNEILILLDDSVEVIIYHPFNPYGMKHYRRTNENNVDLNRNFTTNQFSSENIGYEKAKAFFTPKKYANKLTANLHFYTSLVRLILKFGTKALKEATLLGQKVLPEGIYYSSATYQTSTKHILQEIEQNLEHVDEVLWFDLHTGYGPRYQMSVVNSKYEKESTKEIIDNIRYPLVLGLNADDFYEIDGDMIEMIYRINEQKENPVHLYATCFEFGTLGDSLFNTISSLKAMIFENAAYFQTQKDSFHQYANRLIKEQFMPSESKWKEKAYSDFKQALIGIITYKQFIK